MNYPKQVKGDNMVRKLAIMWALLTMVCFAGGFRIGMTVNMKQCEHMVETLAEELPTEETETEEDMVLYGMYDGECITEEIPLSWVVDGTFTPLDCELDEEMQEFTYYLSRGYNLDFSFVMAVMYAESSFDSGLVSSTGDYGLMQINKVNRKWLEDTMGITELTDPQQNIRAGCFILRKLFEKYQDTEMVLMAYHFGEQGAKKLWNGGVYESRYSQAVLKYQREFDRQLEGGDEY